MSRMHELTIIGAGLAGSLLAVLAARRGLNVTVFERHPDPRRGDAPAGRSINLALAERGRHALDKARLLAGVDRFALPMRGRMLHEPGAEPRLQRYGQREDEVIYSVHRGHLNIHLLDAAEAAGADIHFDHALADIDFERRVARFDTGDGKTDHAFTRLVGADGAGSAVRRSLSGLTDIEAGEHPLGHGYKELTIPPGAGGGHFAAAPPDIAGREFALAPHALHIWPRGGYMMIALPNPDGSFTCTLFLPREGEPSFTSLADAATQRAFVEREFPDAATLMPDLAREVADNPVGFLGTLTTERWHGGGALLLGDAAHAIVPFHGQGMNAAFEDVAVLDDLLADGNRNWEDLCADFQAQRKPNADAIARMALENYEEMRAGVRDPRFHLKKALEWRLERDLPDHFIPRYSMVMFHRIPYAEAERRGKIQAELLETWTRGADSLESVDLKGAKDVVRDRLTPIATD